jgi:predicted Holliday junction resolvase-like endonuclease
MADWIGLLFFVIIIVGAFVGLKILSKPVTRTEEEFERNAAENTTMLGASMNALQELMNPEAAKAKEVQMQMKEGRYLKKKREGKANGGDETE